jgi:hypothetical protein
MSGIQPLPPYLQHERKPIAQEIQMAEQKDAKRSRLSEHGKVPFERAILSPIYCQIHFTEEAEYRQFYNHLRNFTAPYTIYYDAWDELPAPNEIDWQQTIPIKFAVDTEEERIVGCTAHLLFERDWR